MKALEARLAGEERRAAELSFSKMEIEGMASRVGAIHPASVPVMLRRIAMLDLQLKKIVAERDDLRQKLLVARGRQKVITARWKLLRDSAERKAAEEQALETALVMGAKVSGKGDVVS